MSKDHAATALISVSLPQPTDLTRELVMGRNSVRVDGLALSLTHAGRGEDGLNHVVLARAVLVDIGGGRRDPLLDLRVLVTQGAIGAQHLTYCEMVA